MTDIASPDVTDRDVYITRTFAAPRAVVWEFWTDPQRLAEWFGPQGVSTPAERIDVDLREDGHWNLGMTDDVSGEIYPMASRITRLVPEEYLEMVVSAQTSGGDLEDILLRVRFHDHGDRTRLTLHQGPFTSEAKEQTEDGWTQSFDKLDRILTRGNAS